MGTPERRRRPRRRVRPPVSRWRPRTARERAARTAAGPAGPTERRSGPRTPREGCAPALWRVRPAAGLAEQPDRAVEHPQRRVTQAGRETIGSYQRAFSWRCSRRWPAATTAARSSRLPSACQVQVALVRKPCTFRKILIFRTEPWRFWSRHHSRAARAATGSGQTLIRFPADSLRIGAIRQG
jgi:hypothetical protein